MPPRKSSKKVPSNSTTASGNSSKDPIDRLFYSYANKSSGVIEPQGIESLCSDLGVDHTDIRILMLAWKMQAEKQGYFTVDEWRLGLNALKGGAIDNIDKLKKAVLVLEKEVRETSTSFVDFYSYAFQYCLTEERQKNIDIGCACELLDLVLGLQFRTPVDAIIKFLKAQRDNHYKVINMDQWMGFYRFCNEISFPDLSNYDLEHAWPCILDDFVDWVRSNKA